MAKRLYLRDVDDFETREIMRFASARNAPAFTVRRAKLLKSLIENPDMNLEKAALACGFKGKASAYKIVNAFNYEGLATLREKPRSGRPPTHPDVDKSKLIDLALQKPRTLGYPFELWTLRRLQKAFKQREKIHLSSSTIWEWLSAEGLEWKRQQSWFHDAQKHDPEFVEKRGRSSQHI